MGIRKMDRGMYSTTSCLELRLLTFLRFSRSKESIDLITSHTKAIEYSKEATNCLQEVLKGY